MPSIPPDRIHCPHGVSAISFREGKILACKRRHSELWGYPGGKIDAGESPLEALLRELSEETGISLTQEATAFLYEGLCVGDGPHGRPYWVYAFLCHVPHGIEPIPMPGEPQSEWMVPSEFLRQSAFYDFNLLTLQKAGIAIS